VVDLGLDGATPEKVRVRASGTSIVRLDRGDDGGTVGAATLDARLAIRPRTGRPRRRLRARRRARAALRSALERLEADVPSSGTPIPKGPATPTRAATLVTPNRIGGRALRRRGSRATASPAPTARARALADRWQADLRRR
jgi:hypothetical protein